MGICLISEEKKNNNKNEGTEAEADEYFHAKEDITKVKVDKRKTYRTKKTR